MNNAHNSRGARGHGGIFSKTRAACFYRLYRNLVGRLMTDAMNDTIAIDEPDRLDSGAARRTPGASSARMSRTHIVVITLFALLMGLAGTFSVPPLDRDESRFIQATTQMLETGDYINISFQDRERNKKPAGIHWLQAASVSMFSDAEARAVWAYRLPSMLGALMAALFTYWAGCRLFGRDVAFLGTMFLVTSASFGGEATIAKTDAMLLATVCAAQGALSRLFWFSHVADGAGLASEREKRWLPIMFWIAVGIGILIKGPITPMIAFLTLMALCLWAFIRGSAETGGTRISAISALSWLKDVKPMLGLGILAVMVLPWAIAIGIATEGRFYGEAVGTDMLGKISQSQERHGGPIGYHFGFMWLLFWSAALFIPLAARITLERWRNWAVAFCLAWALPSWLVFELTSTKLPHYVLPLYPAIGLLCAFALQPFEEKENPKRYGISKFIGTAFYGLGALVLAGALVVLPTEYQSAAPLFLSYLYGLVILGGAAGVIWLFWRHNVRLAALGSISLGALFTVFALEGTLPHLQDFRLSPRVSQVLDVLDIHPRLDGGQPVALLGYHEPSLVFLLDTDTRILTPDMAANYLSQKPGRVAVVEARFDEDFKTFLLDTPIEKLATLAGYNYSNGKEVTLTIYRSALQ